MPRELTDAEAYAKDENPKSGSDEEVPDEDAQVDEEEHDSQSDPQADAEKPEE